MRTVILCMMMVVFGYASQAQLSLQPRVGVRNSVTNLDFNDLPQFSPLNNLSAPEVSLRLDYKFKKLHGPYLGISTSRNGIDYSFNDLNTGAQVYQASKLGYNFLINGGYEVTTKPYYFKKPPAKSSVQKVEKEIVMEQKIVKKNCGSKAATIEKSYADKSHCGDKKAAYRESQRNKSYDSYEYSRKTPDNMITERRVIIKRAPQAPAGWFVQLQPSVGLSYSPVVEKGIDMSMPNSGNKYSYAAGDFSTAFTSGMNIMFGKNGDPKFLVGINYFKGLGNLGPESITITENGKTTTTKIQSSVSGWSLGLGLPLNLGKKPAPQKKVIEKIIEEKHIEKRYKYHCNKNRS